MDISIAVGSLMVTRNANKTYETFIVVNPTHAISLNYINKVRELEYLMDKCIIIYKLVANKDNKLEKCIVYTNDYFIDEYEQITGDILPRHD